VLPRDFDNIRAVRVLLFLARVMRGRSEGAYLRAAGQHLEFLARGRPGWEWVDLVKSECGL